MKLCTCAECVDERGKMFGYINACLTDYRNEDGNLVTAVKVLLEHPIAPTIVRHMTEVLMYGVDSKEDDDYFKGKDHL